MKKRKKKKLKEKSTFLRPSSSLPSIHLARPGQRNETDTGSLVHASSPPPVYRVREVGINWEGSLRGETNTPRHQARAGPFRKPVLDSPLDPPSFLSSAPGSPSILDELSLPGPTAFAQKNEITSEHRAYTESARIHFFFFFFFFLLPPRVIQRTAHDIHTFCPERNTPSCYADQSALRRVVRRESVKRDSYEC